MRNLTQFLAVCALVSTWTSANAQMSYTTKGGNALTQDVLSTVDLPDGNMLVHATSSGFSWTDNDDVVGGNGSLECSGFSTVSPEGDQLDGSGSCVGLDEDGDIWRIWWSGAMGGEFGFTGGTGKYAGINGGGTWTTKVRYPDGKVMNDWEGTWTIPDHMME